MPASAQAEGYVLWLALKLENAKTETIETLVAA
jgi:hypothetical protein